MAAVFVPSVPGGSWSLTNGSANLVPGLTASVTGTSAGMDTINYVVSNTLCSSSVNKIVTIRQQPDAGSIGGTDTVCAGSKDSLAATVSSGVWSLSNGAAAIDATGVLTGIQAGADTVIYTVTNGWCVASANYVVAVKSLHDCEAAGTHAVANGGDIRVTPNPATNIIAVTGAAGYRLGLYSATGLRVLTAEITRNEQTIDISQLAAGAYLIQLVNGSGGEQSFKLVKN
jgi:hypothetical protein